MIGGLHWAEKNGEKNQIELPPERVKTGRAPDVPLSDLALDVLGNTHRIHGRRLVFGGGKHGFADWSKAKKEFDKVCGVKAWTMHDLRRTCATGMADLGVLPHVVEAVINHVSGHRAGVAGIYNRAVYAPEKRAAVDLWAAHIKLILAKSDGANVIGMPKAMA